MSTSSKLTNRDTGGEDTTIDPIVIVVTCSSAEESQSIIGKIVSLRLAAVGQTWPISSCYWWEGEVVHATEHLVLFKTVAKHFVAVCETVRALHSYELPAIIAAPLSAVGPGYLAWLINSTTSAEQ